MADFYNIINNNEVIQFECERCFPTKACKQFVIKPKMTHHDAFECLYCGSVIWQCVTEIYCPSICQYLESFVI